MSWRGLVLHGIPLIVGIGSALLLLPWIMGASAVQGEGPSRGFNVGLFALFLYPASYQVLIIAWFISRWQKWPLESLFLQLIWVCLLLFVAAMAYSLAMLAPYLQS